MAQNPPVKVILGNIDTGSMDTGWVGELTTSLNIVNIDSRENCYEYVDTNVKSMCG